jgi:hypothetical protein
MEIVDNVSPKRSFLPTGLVYVASQTQIIITSTTLRWSLTLWVEHKLSVFENRVLSKIFGPKRDEATGEWRKLHSEELYT